MPWQTYPVTLADSLLGPRELSVITAHLEGDRRAAILGPIIDLIRSYCGNKSPLGPAGTIPPECQHDLRSLYRYALLADLPVSNLLTEARAEEKRDAIKHLEKIAKGEVAISLPDPVETPTTGLTGSRPVLPSLTAPCPASLSGY